MLWLAQKYKEERYKFYLICKTNSFNIMGKRRMSRSYKMDSFIVANNWMVHDDNKNNKNGWKIRAIGCFFVCMCDVFINRLPKRSEPL